MTEFATIKAYGLKLPSGQLVPVTAAEPDGVLEIVAYAMGMEPDVFTERVTRKGASVVRVLLTELAPLPPIETETREGAWE